MIPWVSWGIPIITWLQSLGPGLKPVMEFFTFLGVENFYLLVLPALLWCVDAGLGIRVGIILLASANLNTTLKLAFGTPRPFWVSDQVRALSLETSFGLPSGHAQNATALWGQIALGVRRRWFTWLMLLLIFMISLSRLYLGVHFPADVLGGWLVGGALLWAYQRAEAPAISRLRDTPLARRILLAFALSLLLLLLGLLAARTAAERGLPAEWEFTARLATGFEGPFNPIEVSGLLSSAGVLFGLLTGTAFLVHGGGFSAQGPLWQRLARFPVGLIGLLAIYLGLKALFPGGDTLLAGAFRYLRYALVGLWVAYGAPWAFARLRLVAPDRV